MPPYGYRPHTATQQYRPQDEPTSSFAHHKGSTLKANAQAYAEIEWTGKVWPRHLVCDENQQGQGTRREEKEG